jgi:hypothetical protein
VTAIKIEIEPVETQLKKQEATSKRQEAKTSVPPFLHALCVKILTAKRAKIFARDAKVFLDLEFWILVGGKKL